MGDCLVELKNEKCIFESKNIHIIYLNQIKTQRTC